MNDVSQEYEIVCGIVNKLYPIMLKPKLVIIFQMPENSYPFSCPGCLRYSLRQVSVRVKTRIITEVLFRQ